MKINHISHDAPTKVAEQVASSTLSFSVAPLAGKTLQVGDPGYTYGFARLENGPPALIYTCEDEKDTGAEDCDRSLMSSIKLSALVFALSITLNAFTFAQDQPQTIFQRDTTFHKGRFFSPAVRVHFYGNDLDTEASTLVGGTFGWVFNRSFLLGVGGFGKITRTRYSASYAQRNEDGQVIHERHPMGLGYGYGGLVLGFVANSNRPVHFTFPVLIGLGTSNEYEIEEDGDHGTTINSPGFFIVEPAINMEVNLLEDLRFNFGLTYRYIDTSRFDELDSGSLNGLGIHVAIKFGSL